MSLDCPVPELETHIDEIITHYPPEHKRAAVLWLLHLLQEHFGLLGEEQVEWTAAKLGLQPINVWELVTLLSDVHRQAAREVPHQGLPDAVVRTVRLRRHPGATCRRNSASGSTRTQPTVCSRFPRSNVSPLCGTGPVMMINDELFENLTPDKAEAIVDRIKATGKLDRAAVAAVQPAHPLEKRVLLANMSKPGYTGSIDDYIAKAVTRRCARRSA